MEIHKPTPEYNKHVTHRFLLLFSFSTFLLFKYSFLMLFKIMATSSTIETICREIYGAYDREKLSIQLLVRLRQSECRKVRETYTKLYGEDLLHLCLNCSSLMLTPLERDAISASDAIRRNDYQALIEIFTSRKSSHVLLVLETYYAKYRSQLDVDIARIEPSNPFQKILMAVCASHKAHYAETSQHIAKCDARRLYETGEGKAGAIEEAAVLEMFSKRSIKQLKLTFFYYKHIYGHSYTSILRNGDFEDAVRVVAKCICNPAGYYAKVVHGCLIGLGGDNGAIGRILVSRAEVDLDEIRKSFKKKYGVELSKAICDTITIPQGDHREFLLEMATKTS